MSTMGRSHDSKEGRWHTVALKILKLVIEPTHNWDKLLPALLKLSVAVYETSGGQEQDAKEQEVKKEDKKI